MNDSMITHVAMDHGGNKEVEEQGDSKYDSESSNEKKSINRTTTYIGY